MDTHFPFESGIYDVSPGLRPLTGKVFLFDRFDLYRRQRLAARASRTIYMESGCPEATKAAAAGFIAARLAAEHPDFFELAAGRLHCRLTGDAVEINSGCLEPLLLQVAEDAAVFQIDGEREYLAAASIALPSSWRLEEKIGRGFAEIHEPVPGMKLAPAAAIARSLASKGPYERFAWGLTNEDVLDQHAPAHAEVQPEPLFIRVERQTTHPLAGCGAWLFTIRPSNTPAERLTQGQREALARALESMTPAQAAYKGVLRTREAIAARLRRD
ncbi:MAG: DUF3445 domain-containing protein [Bryobacteraceae bacterium]|nr:DUF3445 domain-containing protein [Bryobacteraceae bacterium]